MNKKKQEKCPECGADVDICPHCGKRIHRKQPPAPIRILPPEWPRPRRYPPIVVMYGVSVPVENWQRHWDETIGMWTTTVGGSCDEE